MLKDADRLAFISEASGNRWAVVLILFILLVLVTSIFSSSPSPGGSDIASASNERYVRLYNSTNILDLKYLGYTSDTSTSIAVSTIYMPFYDAFVPQRVTYECQTSLPRYARLNYEVIYPTGDGTGISYGTFQVRLRYDNCGLGVAGWSDAQLSSQHVAVEVESKELCRVTLRR
ncbi:hypothetical protein [Paenibacillus herberti]|uniref:Uncharacterized protein n=1 Tax=Paenibacillus herberti TaxID=1619309 RepID=A0A229NUQ8_9BACL|nr:hypothetical protein [Paenibacillus herberti]OXM13564.1 hypothetical protein CGZ75_21255 [Paenibacillus herberti]